MKKNVGRIRMKFEYSVAFQDAGDGEVVISCRDLPEVHSQGSQGDDARLAAEGAIQAAIEYRILEGLELPSPSASRRGEEKISLPPETAAKAALYMVMREEGLTNSDLARRLKVDEKAIRRMLDPGHPTKIPKIAEAIRALGRNLRLELI
jgi:antitoxin HicB